MKHLNQILAGAAVAAFLGLTNMAMAQNSVGYRITEGDGISASPKYRQVLNERSTAASARATSVVAAGYRATGVDGLTASPKLRQFIDASRGVQSTGSTSVAAVGYLAASNDGVSASPKLRQQLTESGTTLTVAPLK